MYELNESKEAKRVGTDPRERERTPKKSMIWIQNATRSCWKASMQRMACVYFARLYGKNPEYIFISSTTHAHTHTHSTYYVLWLEYFWYVRKSKSNWWCLDYYYYLLVFFLLYNKIQNAQIGRCAILRKPHGVVSTCVIKSSKTKIGA